MFAQAPPKAVVPDLRIEAQLHDRLAKSVVGKDGFTARVKDGVVYWSGSTSVAQHKGAATRMAKSAGARRVVNNIVVQGSKVKKPSSPNPVPKSTARSVPKAEVVPVQPPTQRVTVKWRDARP